MRILVTQVALVCVMLGSGCSTQHYKSVHPAHVVAACIAKEWRQCLAEKWGWGTNITRMPTVVTKENTNGCFVGISEAPYPLLCVFTPLTIKHPLCSVWAEVTDTASGSETLYHQAGCTYSRRLNQGVRQSQEMNQ